MACNANSLIEGLKGGYTLGTFKEVGRSGEYEVKTGQFVVLDGVDHLTQNFQ